jgi:hypothetical protein
MCRLQVMVDFRFATESDLLRPIGSSDRVDGKEMTLLRKYLIAFR